MVQWIFEEIFGGIFEWLWTKRWGKPIVVIFLASMLGLVIYGFIFFTGPSSAPH